MKETHHEYLAEEVLERLVLWDSLARPMGILALLAGPGRCHGVTMVWVLLHSLHMVLYLPGLVRRTKH